MIKRGAFTIVEMLVVVTVIILLMALVSPTMRRVMRLVEMDICYSNMRQLSTAWMAYQADNNGDLINGSTHGSLPWAKWGDERPSNDPARYTLITTGHLYPYTRNVKIYLCPADPVEHVRSYSITSLMNGCDWYDLPYVTKFMQIKDPTNQMVFVDEKDKRSSSNMGTFAQDPLCWNKNQWVDYVANLHDSGDNFGFADGHAEHWKWTDPRTLEYAEIARPFLPDPANDRNPDLRRIRKHFFNEMPGAY